MIQIAFQNLGNYEENCKIVVTSAASVCFVVFFTTTLSFIQEEPSCSVPLFFITIIVVILCVKVVDKIMNKAEYSELSHYCAAKISLKPLKNRQHYE